MNPTVAEICYVMGTALIAAYAIDALLKVTLDPQRLSPEEDAPDFIPDWMMEEARQKGTL
jgi:hypothetical protein